MIDAVVRRQAAMGKPWTPERHSLAQIDHAINHLNGLWDPEQRKLRRPLTQDEYDFVQNERRLCALDFRNYWCNPPEAPIWMADHSFKPIGEIKVGDEVVGWEKADRPNKAKQFVRDHYTKSRVVSVARRLAPLIEVTFSSGRTVRCTPDHLWSNGRADRCQHKKTVRTRHKGKLYQYDCVQAARPWTVAKIGATLRFSRSPLSVEELTPELQRTAAWLGGIFDGEGSFSKQGGLSIAQSKTHNPGVCAAIRSALTALGFEYTEGERSFLITGGFRAVARFLTLCQPVRRSRMEQYLFGQVLTQKDRVVAIRDLGEGEVVSLQTTTGNYVAWGYLSKNCTHYAWIVNWQKQPMRFTPNVAQNIIFDLWAEDEAAGLAIWMQQLKARRLGVSTGSELNVCHRFQFQPFANCVVASADPQKTIEMAGMIKYCLESQPWWLLPTVTKVRHGIPIEFGEQHSTLAVEAGNQFTGVARGSAPNIVHLSELCEWMDAEDLIDGALLPAILDDPNVFVIMESTAKGPGWWKRKWEQTKRDRQRGTGRMRDIFLPWYVGTDIYPTQADLRKRPIPPNWIPEDRTIAHAERARQYVLTNPLLFKYLAKGNKDWQMPRAQMWWREMGYRTAKEEKTLNIFLAEFCSDDMEAFQASNIPIIDTEILLGYQERTRNPIGAYTIIGPDIPQALVTPRRYWDHSKPPIPIRTRDVVPKLDVKYQLIPLIFEGYAAFDWDLKLLVWEWPDPAESYGAGVDTSEGIGQDRAIINVLREATPMRGPGQVAEWASAYVTAFQLWPFVMAIGSLYSTFKASVGRKVQARLAIECWANGAACQHELQKRGWYNFHPWKSYDNRKIRTDGEVNKLGVYTNMSFRSQMFDMLLTNLSEEAIDLPSPYLVQELTTLERAGDRRKPQAAPDAYDDRVMAIGFPLFSLHMGKPPNRQYARQRVAYEPGGDPEVKPNYAIWQQEQAMDVPNPALMRPQRSLGLRGQVELLRVVNERMPRGYR